MNDIVVIFQTEFVRRVRSRLFVVMTLIGAAAVVLIAVLPGMLEHTLGDAGKKIVLAGDANLTPQAQRLLAKDYQVVYLAPAIPASPSVSYLDEHGKAAALVVVRGTAQGLKVHVYARDAGAVRSSLGDDLVALNIAQATRVPQARIDKLLVVPVETTSLDKKFGQADAAAAAKGVAFAMVMLLYVAILFNTQSIVASVAEEKTSRIAELLVATVSPTRLLAGKILATAASGSVQIAVWAAAAYVAGQLIASKLADAGAAAATAAPQPVFNLTDVLTPGVVIAFVVFFLLGFVQYALLYAAAASLISRTEDLGSVTGPLVMPVVAGFLFAQFAVLAPNSANVVALSMVPLISPFVMFTRITVATIPIWQIVLSVAINAGAALLIAVAAGKVYRVGLLTYGRAPKLTQIWATLRA